MKHTKKLLLAVLCVALVLASTLLVVAACGPKTYTVTLEQYDKTQGTVQYTLPAEGEAYTENENVTVTVSPAEGYEVGSVKVNGTEVQLENGAYSFKIAQDTTISVTFRKLLNVTVTVNIPEGITNSDSWLSAPANGTKYADGETVTLTLVPHADYEIESVKIGTQTLTAADGKYTFQATTDPTEVQVTVKKVKFSVTVSSTPSAGGTALLSQPEAGAGQKYALNEEVTLTVAANANYFVKSITINGVAQQDVSQPTYTITVTQDTTIAVEFAPTYTVTVYCNPSEGGTYTLEPQKARYNEGEEVTLSVSAAANYVLDEVRVNTTDRVAPEEDGTYKIKVTQNTSIDVDFITYTASVLKSVQGSARFEGTISWATYNTDVLTIFDETPGNQSLLIQQSDDGYYSYVLAGVNQSGKLYAVLHDPENGGSANFVQVTSNDQPIDYNTYNNPFASLVEANLTSAGDGLWTVSNEIAANIILRLTRDAVTVSSVQLREEDGKIVSINITATIQVRVGASGQTQSMPYTAEFEVSEHGTAAVPENMIGNAPTDSNFKNALTNAAAADSYSLTVEYLGDTVEFVYADNAFYRISENGGSGYYERVDGSVWSFTYNDAEKQFVKGEQALASGGIAAINALFDIKDEDGDYYSLFYDAGDGAYKVYANDQMALTQDLGRVGYIAYYFFDIQPLGFSSLLQNAWDITITLGQDGAFTVDIPCYYSNGVSGMIIPISLSFSDFGTTELPFEIPQSEIDGSVDPAFTGEYIDEAMQYRLYATLDGFVFNSVYVGKENITANEDGSLTLRVDGKEYTLKQGEAENTLILNDGKADVTLVTSEWFEWVGTYTAYRGLYPITITPTQVLVTISGHQYVAEDVVYGVYTFRNSETGQTMRLAEFDFTANGKNYFLQQSDEGNYEILLFGQDGNTQVLDLLFHDVEGLNIDLTPYYGTYESLWGTNNSITIGANGIIATIDGQTHPASMVGVYTASYNVQIINLTVNGVDYTLQQYGENGTGLWILFVDGSSEDLFIITNSQADPQDYSDFYGTFYDDDGKYKVILSADGILFYVDDQEKQVTASYFDLIDYTQRGGETDMRYQLYFFADGTWYYVQQYPERYDILFLGGEDETSSRLYKDKYEELAGSWSDRAGEYEGEGYKVSITADGISITPPEGEATPVTDITYFSDYDYSADAVVYGFEFTYDGKECAIYIYDDDSCLELDIPQADGVHTDAYILINKEYSPEYDLTKLVGYWTGEGVSAGNTKYIVKVTAEGIWLAVGDGELQQLTVVYYSDSLGYICELDGARWRLVYISENDDAAGTFAMNILLYGNDDLAMLSLTAEPSDWADYVGTWSGNNTVGDTSVTYTVVIDATTLHITSSDGTYDFTVDKNTDGWKHTKGYTWVWNYDGKQWNLKIEEEKLNLYYDAGHELDADLTKQDSPAPKPELDLTGAWYTSYGENQLIILSDKVIYLNGSAATEIVKTDTGFTFTWKSYQCTITYNEEEEVLTLSLGAGSSYEFRQCEWGSFLGIWYSGTQYGYETNQYVLVVTTTGITLVSGNSPQQGTFSGVGQLQNGNYAMNFTIGSTQYQLQQANPNFTAIGLLTEQGLVSFFWKDQTETADVGDLLDNLPAVYQGEYEGVTYKLEIAENGTITVTVDGTPTVAQEVEIEAYVNYFTGYYYGVASFTLGGKEAYLYIAVSGDYVGLELENVDEQIILYHNGAKPDWSDLIGTYQGKVTSETSNSTTYKLTIAADKVTLQIGDAAAVDAEIELYDTLEGFTLYVDGKYYFAQLKQTTQDVYDLYLSDATSFRIMLEEVEEQPATNALVGTWTGTWDDSSCIAVSNKPVTIEFKADGTFTIAVDGDLEFTGHYTYDAASGKITVTDMNVGIFDFIDATFTLDGEQLSIDINVEQDSEGLVYKASGLTKQA